MASGEKRGGKKTGPNREWTIGMETSVRKEMRHLRSATMRVIEEGKTAGGGGKGGKVTDLASTISEGGGNQLGPGRERDRRASFSA